MTAADPFGLGQPERAKAPSWLTGLKNVGMFFAALIVTVMVASFFKSAIASTNGRAAGRYYLETTSALRVGDVLSPSNTVWRSSVGKRGGDSITSDTKGADAYWGWRVLSPIRAGQPVSKGSVVNAVADQNLAVPQGKVGFVLTGDELSALTEVLAPGAHVDVIAVTGGARSHGVSPSVATLAQNARVLHVRAGIKRGGRGLDAAVTLAVAPDEAEDMAAWRRNGNLVLTLSGPQSADPSRIGQWRELVESQDDAADVAEQDQDESPASERPVPVASHSVSEPSAPSVAVITPAGARRQAYP